MRRVWTLEDIRALGVATNLKTAADILGLSYTTARALADNGRFPIPLTRAGRKWIVPVAGLLRLLDPPDPTPGSSVAGT